MAAVVLELIASLRHLLAPILPPDHRELIEGIMAAVEREVVAKELSKESRTIVRDVRETLGQLMTEKKAQLLELAMTTTERQGNRQTRVEVMEEGQCPGLESLKEVAEKTVEELDQKKKENNSFLRLPYPRVKRRRARKKKIELVEEPEAKKTKTACQEDLQEFLDSLTPAEWLTNPCQ